ncbi:hypothetical protein [Allochromatium vinosum]|uniref:Uncharacterized protein n=1 Tax=Allochromatium vinosum (strain ATCC 17899 / DSM 180 / NBRC 103801 / NCIMB 10441 / D) TaxID=572477 RepID=D3RTE0_ALLVD|nr:hypothetical protein [Allochromatium vinosum]ADC62449.1 hypothetical protein Alvin_1516 [Allochromatium vinosum DSM 180]MBK1653146.1 hypothetical protein [Allochromatium vinosum]
MSEATFDLVDARDSFMDTDWFHHCRQTRTPYIVIRSAETSADVLWDYVTLSPEADVRIRTDFAAFEREARAIFERCAGPDSYLRIKPTQICFDHLALDRAKRAALDLYRLVETYLSARPVMREPEHARPSLREAAASIA